MVGSRWVTRSDGSGLGSGGTSRVAGCSSTARLPRTCHHLDNKKTKRTDESGKGGRDVYGRAYIRKYIIVGNWKGGSSTPYYT